MGAFDSIRAHITRVKEHHHQQSFTDKEAIVKRGPEGTTLYTGGGNDVVYVTKNPDGSATVTVNGEKHEFSEAEARSLTIDSGNGDDVVIVSGDLNVAVRGQAGDDFIRGGDGDDNIDGGTGDDDIDGMAGDDTLAGGAGYDVMNGGDGDDTMSGGAGFDTMNGGDGDDTMRGDAGNDVMRGGDGNDNMNGGWGNDLMEGEAGNDVMNGGWGKDDVFGGDGDDQLWGGPQLRRGRGWFPGWGGGFPKWGGLFRQHDNLVGGAGNDTINGRPERWTPSWWGGGILRSNESEK